MKTITSLFLGLLVIGATAAYGGPSVKVTVSDASGKTVYESSTNASGVFRTPHLPPGNYVVQFRSDNAALRRNQYLIVVGAGVKKVVADAVEGERFAGGGVAMRLKVGYGANIEGQMANENAVSVFGDPHVKVLNGHRYVFVASMTGSTLGPHWVDERLVGIERNIVALDRRALIYIQDHAGEGSLLDRYTAQGHAASELGEYGH
jgi:hypothetical protein